MSIVDEVATSAEAFEASPIRIDEVSEMGIALAFDNVSKSFGSVQALLGISLEIHAGEVHAIVGENGAGKSTLMAIASGALSADEGLVAIGGSTLLTISPTAARDLGLAICRQTPSLMNDLRVSENLAIAVSAERRPEWRRITGWSIELLTRWQRERPVDPSTFVRSLDPGSRAMVEITKAVSQRPRVLLLDEPTEALGGDEIERLFEIIRELAADGTAVVYISHRIPDVMRIADRITVLRDGVLRGTHDASAVSEADIVQEIVGSPLEFAFPPKSAVVADQSVVISVVGLRCDHVSGVDLEVRKGEILGISGVEGNGQSEVIRALAGLVPAGGAITVAGKKFRPSSPARAEAAGIVYLPADRHAEGIWPSLGVRENITTTSLMKFAILGFVLGRRESRAVSSSIQEFGIKTTSAKTEMGTLSGGNQQKAVIARAIMREPRVILAHEPTQGIDVGSRLDIYRILRERASAGAVIVVSSDAAELEGLCDRVLVMSRGRVVRELTGVDVTEEKMTEAALMATGTGDDQKGWRGESRLLRFAKGDHAPVIGILAVTLLLVLATAISSKFYFTEYSIQGILSLFATLALAAMAQQVIMIVGGIDLSIGPAMSLLVVIGSFWLAPSLGPLALGLGMLGLVVIAAVIALANWFPTVLGVPPLIATLVTFVGLQGLALLIRPTSAGSFDPSLLSALTSTVGWVPAAAIAVLVIAVTLEVMLRRTRWGAQVRAVGSNPTAAYEAGIKVPIVRLAAGLVAALLVVGASLLLAAQVGGGDATSGTSFTLAGVTAAVVGGASILGGRGSLLGAMAGALLIQQINATTVFLGLDLAWQSYLLGGLTLVAAGTYSLVRKGARNGR